MSSIKHTALVDHSIELLIKSMMQSKHLIVELGSQLGLTSMQSLVLILLSEPQPMHDLTKTLSCDASNVTGIIDGLEQKALAARFPDINDRRIKMIKLSSKGKTLRNELLSSVIKSHDSMLIKLNNDELNDLLFLLHKITTD